jgi:FtsZ-interacting cell division protein ZipA
MFESISWQEFISTIALLIGGYYAITVLLLYSKEITNIFKQRKLNLTNTNVRENQTESNESIELMGSVRYASSQSENVPREEKVEAESLSVVAAQEPEEPITEAVTSETDDALLKSVSTLLEEINTLTEVVAVGSKEECAELFRTLLSNYADLSRTAHEPEITAFIYNSCKEHCEFQIELNEVRSWWPNSENTAVTIQ